MVMKKSIRTKGKIQLSRYFQSLKEGDSVAVIREPSIDAKFPERIQGRTGNVVEKRGRAYIVKIMDHDKEKRFIIEPIHLKKITK
ncbi:MAG: 50S ribosomal protein L21e [Candidatus Pacearchaeota archaeon]|nr:50S ribosomal protein L21e [Nanoarchaeota archaeon]MDZ4226717.1 50S ribosomal protein L21e [Candidatus Pacearchaeota archaeon]